MGIGNDGKNNNKQQNNVPVIDEATKKLIREETEAEKAKLAAIMPSRLVEFAKQALKEEWYQFNGGTIDKDEKKNLESLNKGTPSAQILIREDGRGAWVLSADGKLTTVTNKDAPPIPHNGSVEKEREMLGGWIRLFGFEDGKISPKRKEDIEEFAKIYDNVSVVINKDMKSATIVDRNGDKSVITAPKELKDPSELTGDAKILYEAYREFSKSGITHDEHIKLNKIDDVLKDACLNQGFSNHHGKEKELLQIVDGKGTGYWIK